MSVGRCFAGIGAAEVGSRFQATTLDEAPLAAVYWAMSIVDQGMGAYAEFLLLAGVLVAFFLLSKLYARRPKAEPWLVAGTLATFIPAVSIVLPFMTGRYGHSQTFLLMLIIAPLMGGAWWLIKNKTDWLASPGAPTFKAESPVAVVQPPPQRKPASAKLEVRPAEAPAPPAPSAASHP